MSTCLVYTGVEALPLSAEYTDAYVSVRVHVHARTDTHTHTLTQMPQNLHKSVFGQVQRIILKITCDRSETISMVSLDNLSKICFERKLKQ